MSSHLDCRGGVFKLCTQRVDSLGNVCVISLTLRMVKYTTAYSIPVTLPTYAWLQKAHMLLFLSHQERQEQKIRNKVKIKNDRRHHCVQVLSARSYHAVQIITIQTLIY